jgi:hypothetical protein
VMLHMTDFSCEFKLGFVARNVRTYTLRVAT